MKISNLSRLAILLVALALAPILPAQATSPAAPIPPQIAAAKTVFLSYAGAECAPSASFFSGSQDRGFDEFSAGARSKLHYQFVSNPADADLVLAFRSACTVYPSEKFTSVYTQFFLTAYDPKYHVALWTFAESPKLVIGLQKTRDTQFDIAITNLIDDVERASTGLPQPSAPAK